MLLRAGEGGGRLERTEGVGEGRTDWGSSRMGAGDSVTRTAGIECTLPESDCWSVTVEIDWPLLDSIPESRTSLEGSGVNEGEPPAIGLTTATSSIFLEG